MKEIFANSPCFENMSKSLEISTMNDEISALVEVILSHNEIDEDIQDILRFLQEINLEYRNYFTDSWQNDDVRIQKLDSYITTIFTELGSIKGFTKPAQSRLGSLINLLRTKNRQVTRLFYILEMEENIDVTHQKVVFSLMNNLLYYTSLLVDKRNGFEIRYK